MAMSHMCSAVHAVQELNIIIIVQILFHATYNLQRAPVQEHNK